MKKEDLIFLQAVFLVLCFQSCVRNTSVDNSGISADAASIAKGKAIFEQHCISCHHSEKESKGPPLGGLTSVVPASWIKDFIKSPVAVIESGDERAQRLIVKYNELMPAFGQLSEDELNAVVSFLHTQKATGQVTVK